MPPKRKPGPQGPPTKRRKKTVKETDKEPTTFLSLPAELRNEIYELALVQKKLIKINRCLREPRLLRVSRQIRAEARKIWYLQNRFEVKVQDCDGELAAAFARRAVRSYLADEFQDGEVVNVTYRITGSKSWRCVMDWCRRIHEHGLHAWTVKGGKHETPLVAAVAAAHAIVEASVVAGGSWEKCQETLRAFLVAVGKVDKSWTVKRRWPYSS